MLYWAWSTEVDHREDHLVIRLTTYGNGVLLVYTKQQHWSVGRQKMHGERRLTVLSIAHLGHDTNDDDDYDDDKLTVSVYLPIFSFCA